MRDLRRPQHELKRYPVLTQPHLIVVGGHLGKRLRLELLSQPVAIVFVVVVFLLVVLRCESMAAESRTVTKKKEKHGPWTWGHGDMGVGGMMGSELTSKDFFRDSNVPLGNHGLSVFVAYRKGRAFKEESARECARHSRT
jgi:hypothetical protein